MVSNISNNTRVGIVLPAYNEGSVIYDVLSALPNNIKLLGRTVPVEIIVVNDGSNDNTQEQIEKTKGVTLINHILNSGAGAATRTGLHHAQNIGCDFVVTMDSDGQHAVADAVRLIEYIAQGKADFVIGSRLIDSQGMPWYRVLGNRGLSLITFIMFSVFVTDSQSGLKALNTKAMDSISYRSNNFAFCSEMLWHAKKAKLRIKEIPIQAIYSDYSLAKGQTNWDVVHIIRQMVKQRIMGLFDG
jgi:glycosyltransferase involved in cell wall biosynthesis